MTKFGRIACIRTLVLTAVAGLIGCSSNNDGGDQNAPANGTVRGRVTLDGAPMANVAVVLINTETPLGAQPITNGKGEYEVRWYNGQGLPPGNYKVSIQPSGKFFATSAEQTKDFLEHARGGGAKSSENQSNIPPIYQRSETSGLLIEVVSGDNPPFDFNLRSGK